MAAVVSIPTGDGASTPSAWLLPGLVGKSLWTAGVKALSYSAEVSQSTALPVEK